MELDDGIYEKIKALAAEGDRFVDRGDFAQGISKYDEAMDLLPEPITDWSATTWLLTAIGEAYFFSKDYKQAYAKLAGAMCCPDAIGNPFIHLRLGQVQFELGNDMIAADELARAYMGGGTEIFQREDPKYFRFVTERLDEPSGGW